MSQIFKNQIPIEMLYELLDKICVKHNHTTNSYYLYNINSFKKGMYNQSIPNFLVDISPFYHISKRVKYLERSQTNISFATILRQICNLHSIKYTSEIKYDKSSYDIEYYIYLQEIEYTGGLS